MGIILASASPRRKELLERMGLDFEVRVTDLDETMDPFAHPADEVARVAALKAKSVTLWSWASLAPRQRPSLCFAVCPDGIIRS